MISANTRSALAALDAVRPLIVRLDERRHPEDAAADLIEGWAGVETALRAMVGGSSLSGQALVSDVRAAGLLDYPHAHALLGFLAARDRATRPDYQPTAEDVASARAGFQAIEAANGSGIAADTDTHPTPAQMRPTVPQGSPTLAGTPAGATVGAGTVAPLPPPPPPVLRPPAQPVMRNPASTPPPPRPAQYEEPTPAPRRSPALLLGLLALVLALGAGAYFLFGNRGGNALEQGVAAYQAGRRGDARRSFEEAARADAKNALPHVYLGRMAREDGDFSRATTELTTALQLDPASALAAREMGTVQLVSGQPALAVKFFTRALERDGTDRLASGGMACALMQQGNTVAADRFFARAGSGSWDTCRQMAPGGPLPAGMVPGAPGMTPAGAVPPGTRVPLQTP